MKGKKLFHTGLTQNFRPIIQRLLLAFQKGKGEQLHALITEEARLNDVKEKAASLVQ